MWWFKNRNLFFYIVSFLFWAGLYACGYHIVGKPVSSLKGEQILSIGVESFVNHTNIPGLGWIVTDSVINELSTWPGIRIEKPDQAEYKIGGEIIKYQSQIPNIYRDTSQYPLEYQLSVSLNVYFYPKEDKTPPVEMKEVIAQQSYEIVYFDPNSGDLDPDIMSSKHEEYKALSEAIRRLVQSVIDKIFIMESRDVT